MRKPFYTMILIVAGFAIAVATQDSETIGGVALGDNVKVIIKKFGQPESKSKREYDPDYHSHSQTYNYPSKGISFDLTNNSVGSISVTTPKRKSSAISSGVPTIKTGRGIYLGSTRSDVMAAYSGFRIEKNGESLGFDCPSEGASDEGCGCVSYLYLTYLDDKVTEMKLEWNPVCAD